METHGLENTAAATQPDEASCRAILDALGDAVLVHDATTGEIREVNRKFCNLLGYSPEEARRLNIRDLAGDGHYPLDSSVLGQPGLLEWQIKDSSGRQVWVEAHLSRAVLKDGEQVCAVLRDISPRKQAEVESFTHPVMEGALAGVYLIQDGKFRYVNQIMAQKFGYRPEEIIDRLGPLDLVHPEDREIAAASLRRRLSGEETIAQYCLRGRRRDGSTSHCEILSRYTEYRGRPAILGILLDITERKVAEEALKEAQERFRQLADNLEAVFWMRPLNERQIIYINAAYERIWGRTIDSLMERPETWLEAVHPEDREHLQQRINRKSAEEFGEDEYRIIRPDGQVRWINTRTFPVRDGKGEIYRVAGISVDITARKYAEEALRQTGNTLQALIAATPLAIIALDRDLLVQLWNPAAEKIFGWSESEVLGRPLPIIPPDDWPEALGRIQRGLQEGECQSAVEMRRLRRDGTMIDVSLWTAPLRNSNGEIVGDMGIFVDISGRKRMEEALLASEANYRTIFNAVDEGIAVVDLETGNFLDVNQKWCRMTGFSPEEARGLNVVVLFIDEPPFTGADALQWIKEASKHGPQFFEYVARTREGRRYWVEINLGRTIIGGQERLLVVVRDITERKEAEEALRISEDNYRTIYNSSNDGIAAIEVETGKFLDINRRWMKITGYTKEETAKLTFAPFCLEEQPFTQEDGWGWFRKATEEGPQVFEWRFKNKRGKLQLVEVNLTRTPIGGKDCILANVRDISARKRAEEELRLSEAKYRNLVEQIPAIIFVTAMDNLIGPSVYLSPQIKDILGFTPEEWLADPEIYKNRIHPADRDRVLTELLLSYSQGGPFAAEYRMLSKSGRIVWIREESRAVFDSRGRPLFVQGVAMDITKRKKSEEALQEASSKLRALVQASPLAIVGLDLQGKVISWNPAAERIFGWGRDEVVGRPHPSVPGKSLGEFNKVWRRVLEGQKLLGLELHHQRKDGSLMDVSLSSAPLYDAAGNLAGAMGVFEDITARMRTEEALRASEARFRAMFEGAPIGIAVADLQRGTIIGNPALREMGGGFSEAEINQIKGEEATHPDDWEADNALFTDLIAGKRDRFQKETRYRHKQGHWIWSRLSVSLVKDAAGQPHLAICMVEDITQHKKAEEAAAEIRRQQEAILSNIPDIAWLKDRDCRVIAVNEPYVMASGKDPRELVGKTDMEIWPAYLALKYRADDLEVMSSGQRKRVEEPVKDKKGHIFWVETIKTPIFNEHQEVIGTAGIARDISERRRMEEALRRVSRALKAVTECHQALLRATNETELLSEVCRIIVEVGGYRMAWVGYAQQDEAKSVEPMAHKGFDKGYMQAVEVTWADTKLGQGPVGTAIRTGKPALTRDTQSDPRFAPWREEALKRGFASILALPLLLGDAQPFGALTIYATEPNAFDDEEIDLLIGLANDLAFGLRALRTGAERRRAEEAMRESETKYRSLMDGASDAIVLADSRGKITEVNRNAVKLLGYPEAELLGMNYSQIHPPRIRDHVMENFQGILTSGRGPLHECLVRRKDGEEIHVDVTHNMVENGDHEVVQAVFRDITERQRAQEALRDSEQKLRLLASQLLTIQEKERRRVSRELHDELGQALTVLKIHLVAIENRLRRDQDDLKSSCEQLQNYIDAVIENVRRLSRDLSPSILEDLGLSSSLKYLIEEICRNNHMLCTMALDEIDHLFSPEARINIYRIFQESLTNIVRHAEASRIEVEIKREKDLVTFRLKDDGQGFDLKKARSRSLGKRGLGLTAMHERALMSAGSLNIRSRKGKGTEITLTIPIQE